jgi:hypothetical protein
MLVSTNDKSVIYSTAKNLLLSEVANEPPEISYRLLGVKLSNLADDGVTTNQLTIDAMLRNQELARETKSVNSVHRVELPGLEKGASSNETNPRSDLVTQEDPIPCEADIVEGDSGIPDQGDATIDELSTNESQKRSNSSEPRIESFFRKRARTAEHGNKQGPPPGASVNQFYSQEDDEVFFDADSRTDVSPESNKLCHEEQQQSATNSEDFQCPYCFKPFADFELLEFHAANCRFKTSIDVNKSFFSQKSSSLQSPISSSTSQVRNTRAKSTSKKSKDKNQASQSTLTSSLSSFKWPASSQVPKKQSNGNSSRVSFYQRFIESNSQSLSQSVKIEPFNCPYCFHGFLDFSTLEIHVIMCTKRESS